MICTLSLFLEYYELSRSLVFFSSTTLASIRKALTTIEYSRASVLYACVFSWLRTTVPTKRLLNSRFYLHWWFCVRVCLSVLFFLLFWLFFSKKNKYGLKSQSEKFCEIMTTSLLGTYLFLFITLLAKLTEQNIVPLEAAFQGKL